ncbi:MAG: hypothetical protein E6Q96_00295 [Cyclobacteriaceae bacterium]|nr:MAG: hypothetical protein E6Q96_00295 [Cyclobacteriaceae bacterium]
MRLIILLLITFSTHGQSNSKLKAKPSTLEECYPYLDKIFDDTSKYTFKVFPERIAVSRLHHGLGTWIRNEWGLWRNSKLKNYFVNLGVLHPDDMSAMILTSYHRRLNEKEIKIEEQIEYCQEFYKHINVRNDSVLYSNMEKQIEEDYNLIKNLFRNGDTVQIEIYAPEKRLFQTYATSVTGYAVINDTMKMTAEIVEIKSHKRRTPEKKVGDSVRLDIFSVSLIPPRNWR